MEGHFYRSVLPALTMFVLVGFRNRYAFRRALPEHTIVLCPRFYTMKTLLIQARPATASHNQFHRFHHNIQRVYQTFL